VGCYSKEDFILKWDTKGREVQIDPEDLPVLISNNWAISDGKYLHNSKLGLFHRLITNCPADMLVDHINQDTFDYRKENLRITNKGVNAQNSSRVCRGVHKRGSKFRSYIDFKSERIYLGSHSSIEIAATHYDMAAIYLYGEFAGLNYPERRNEYLGQLKKLEVEDDI
jgi:hypothetical protein